MLFNSYIFVFIFFPICLVGYHILREKQATLAKVWLTCFSLWFYGYFHLQYLLIMVGSILVNYGLYLLLMRYSTRKKQQRLYLAFGVVLNLSVLFYFKYVDFLIGNMNYLFGKDWPLLHIMLPLGISFFTFQQISFLADTYRGELKGCSFVDYALFVSFFPQLIAGPIVTHEEMLLQFANIGKNIPAEAILLKDEAKAEGLELTRQKKTYDSDKIESPNWTSYTIEGLTLFILGLSKKVLIADTFGVAVDYVYADVFARNSFESLLVVLFYTLQLYFDFSGYCDMAIGIGKMLGIYIPVNFNSPYKAVNIIDFWKRWHITLSRFFTKNIYIPLGGNRKGPVRMYCNLFLVFFLSGLWHGAGWNFILWGVMHGVLYVLTRAWQKHKKMQTLKQTENLKTGESTEDYKLTTTRVGNVKNGSTKWWNGKRTLGTVFTFLYVNIAWVYFRAASITEANQIFKNIFAGNFTKPVDAFLDAFNLSEFWYPMKVLHITNLPNSKSYLMIAFTLVTLGMVFFGKNAKTISESSKPTILNACLLAVLFVWCVLSLSGVSTFLYFNF